MIRIILILLLSQIFISCSSIGSGHYIRVKPGENVKTLAKEFKVPAWQIRQANGAKKVISGEWIYIPLKRGVLSQSKNVSSEYYFQHGKLAWPVPSSKNLSSRFGRRWGKAHKGIDIAARTGTAIVAAEKGVVVYSGKALSGYGNLTVIAHESGLFTIYAHADKNFTRKNDKVHRGQVIANVGATGRATGPHLHFEVRIDSKAINPLKFLAYKD